MKRSSTSPIKGNKVNLTLHLFIVLANEEEILQDVEQLFNDNSLEEMEEALNIVNDTLKHEPIFTKTQALVRQDEDVDEEEDNTLEDIAVGVYEALPSDVQDGIREGYENMVER